jgi:cell division protein FtsB
MIHDYHDDQEMMVIMILLMMIVLCCSTSWVVIVNNDHHLFPLHFIWKGHSRHRESHSSLTFIFWHNEKTIVIFVFLVFLSLVVLVVLLVILITVSYHDYSQVYNREKRYEEQLQKDCSCFSIIFSLERQIRSLHRKRMRGSRDTESDVSFMLWLWSWSSSSLWSFESEKPGITYMSLCTKIIDCIGNDLILPPLQVRVLGQINRHICTRMMIGSTSD